MESAREMFQLYFEKFATTTVIRVFNFIRTSAFLVERLFWLAILIGFTATTIWSVTQTFETFVSEPTASRVSFLSNSSKGMTFSDALLCLEVRSDLLSNIYEDRFAKVIADVKKADFPSSLEKKLAAVHESEDQRLATLLIKAQKLENASGEAADTAFSKFHQLEHRDFTDDDLALISLTMAMFINLTDLEMGSKRFSRKFESAWIPRLRDALVGKGANFSELFRFTAEMLCVVLQIRFGAFQLVVGSTINRYTAINFCKYFSSPSYAGHDLMGNEVFCYRLSNASNPPLVFVSPFDYVVLTAHLEALYKATPEMKIVLDLGGKYAIEQQPPIIVPFNQKLTVRFSLETVSTLANLRRRGCWEKMYEGIAHPTTQTECKMWCKIEVFAWVCGCDPLVRYFSPRFTDLRQGLRSCPTIADAALRNLADEECRRAIDRGSENCTLQCYDRDCESVIFASSIDEQPISLNATTVVKLMQTKFVYQKVEEYLMMDSKTLITSLGGNLSLYLGASFLALIHIVVFFVKLPFELAWETGKEEAKKAAPAPAPNSKRIEETIDSLAGRFEGMEQQVGQLRRELNALSHKKRGKASSVYRSQL